MVKFIGKRTFSRLKDYNIKRAYVLSNSRDVVTKGGVTVFRNFLLNLRRCCRSGGRRHYRQIDESVRLVVLERECGSFQ